jgi:hypothetical protein
LFFNQNVFCQIVEQLGKLAGTFSVRHLQLNVPISGISVKMKDWGSESQEEGTLKIQRREATEIAALKLQVSALTKELSDVRSILSKAIKRIETLERTCKTANSLS